MALSNTSVPKYYGLFRDNAILGAKTYQENKRLRAYYAH